MRIYVVLKTTASNDGVVTKALKAFKSEESAEKFLDEYGINESVESPSISYLNFQEIDLEE